MSSINEIYANMTPEKRAFYDKGFLEKQINGIKKASHSNDDAVRPLFGKNNLSEEEKLKLVEDFKSSYLYDFLKERLTTEELNEFIYGQIPWDEYLKSKQEQN